MNATGHAIIGVNEVGGSHSAICLCGFTAVGYRREKAMVGLYMHIVQAVAKKSCPTPDKKAFPNQQYAENAVAKFLRAPKPGARPTRAYRCRCGAWHITKKPASERGKVA
jgi:hypothetical protein